MTDLKQRRFGDEYFVLPDQFRGESVEHRKDQGSDLKSVHIGVGADDDPTITQPLNVKGRHIFAVFFRNVDPASQYFNKVHDDVVFENRAVVGLQAVQDLPAHRDNGLELSIPRHLDRAERRVSFHDIKLSLIHILRAAVDKHFHAIGHVDLLHEVAFYGKSCLLRLFTAPSVQKHLIGRAQSLFSFFDEPDIQFCPDKVGHEALNETVVDRTLGLVFVTCDRRK